jgi:hypothetical protein
VGSVPTTLATMKDDKAEEVAQEILALADRYLG